MADAVTLGVVTLSAALGLAALWCAPDRWVNRLVCILILVRGAVTLANAEVSTAPDAGTALSYARLVTWYSLPVAPLLAGIAIVLSKERPLGLKVLLVGGGLAATGGLLLQALVPGWFVARVAFISGLYTPVSGPLLYPLAAVTLLAEAVLAAVVAAEARKPAADPAGPRAAVVLFAIIPLQSFAFFTAFAASTAAPLNPAFTARAVAAWVAGIVVIAAVVFARVRGGGHVVLLASFVLGALDGVLAASPRLFAALPGYEPNVLPRLLFAAAAVFVTVRYGLADAGIERRRRTEDAASAFSGFALLFLLFAGAVGTLGANLAGYAAGGLFGLAAVFAARHYTPRLGQTLARRLLLPPDDPRAVAERARTYAAAVAAARDAGPEGERLLAQMRDDLGITLQEHELLVSGVASRERERYTTVQTLGRGSTAQVELALDEVAGKRVVVKRFKGLRDPAAVLKEARSLAAVRHPRVVPFLEVDRRGDDIYLVLAYAEGGSARQLLDRDGPLPPERAVALTRDLLEGIEALHAAGLVHCDVKPENLLLDADGRGMLGDFGSARFVAPDLADATLTGAAAEGSLSTIAPEALRGAPPAPARDVYAAGALLYRLLTGAHYVDLHDATVFQARERITLDPPRLPHPRVPAALEPVLRKALAKKPGERYASAREMRDALERVTPAARARP